MSVFSGDFLGITLGDVHSSQLNITRVSSGDRYDDALLPTLKDTTAEVPGGDGTYYWDTSYTSKSFVIDFAYDDLRDEDLRKLRQVFGFKGIKPLIFDEFPYKQYMVKCTTPPDFKYICFDKKDIRLYKGEGTVVLTAYYPYALATTSTTITGTSLVNINNEGDLPAHLKIYIPIYNHTTTNPMRLQLSDVNSNLISFMELDSLTEQSINDAYVMFDSTTHLLEGVDTNYNKTGHLYNSRIKNGDFFEAPLGQSRLTCEATNIHEPRAFHKVTYTPIYY